MGASFMSLRSSPPNSERFDLSDLTIAVLFYGDYPDLARRVLPSLCTIALYCPVELRIGCNACSAETLSIVESYRKYFAAKDLSERILLEVSSENIYKYPMMRRLIDLKPLPSLFMWFDDDSYITSPDPIRWAETVLNRMNRCDMLGSIYTIRLQGNQHLWIQDQPWYKGKPVAPGKRVRFATGGWWCVRSQVLYAFNYPFPDLRHRGGDVMLGEALFQNDYRLDHFNEGVAINADAEGRESKSPRRGYDELPVGVRYQPSSTDSSPSSPSPPSTSSTPSVPGTAA